MIVAEKDAFAWLSDSSYYVVNTIKNKGFKSVNGNFRGDFVFTVIVQTPKKLTREQRDLLTELAKTMNEQPPIKKRGIFG